jgi:anti-sigma factor RsiW
MAEHVTDYMEGNLPWRRRWAAWLHLKACKACTAYYQQMRRTIALLHRMPARPLPESEVDTVLRRADPPAGP